MKHVPYFNDFLKDNVNLNQSRLTTLDNKISIISNLLKGSYPRYQKYSEQGSYAHQTIIKPVQGNDEFDADMLVFVKDESFRLGVFSDYIKEIYDVFKEDHNYKDIVRLKKRCVTLDYAGDFHLDIVPCIEFDGAFYICNRQVGGYEETDGDGYKRWLMGQNTVSGSNNLRKVIRLLKFLRDHKDNFSVKSILLATLLGNAVESFFEDVPSALKGLSNGVNDFLQGNPYMPAVLNPVLPEENFNRNWNEKQYANFREKFNIYAQKINDAYNEKDHNESVKKWRKLFGDNFGELHEENRPSKKAVILTTGVGATSAVYANKPYAADWPNAGFLWDHD